MSEAGDLDVVPEVLARLDALKSVIPRRGTVKPRQAHIWKREAADHYVEPKWLSVRLFEVEDFNRSLPMLDPCTGWGRVAEAAKAAGYRVVTADIVDRGYPGCVVRDFLKRRSLPPNCSVVCNPPFQLVRDFICHALRLGARKCAVVFPIPRINAAWSWLRALPLQRIWLLTPRPSMPPGYVIEAGERPKGGKEDFAWLVFVRGYTGKPQVDWLHRDGDICHDIEATG